MQPQQRSRLMYLSWEIQRKKKCTRSKSLFAARAIYLNEDITVYHLVKKHSHERYPNKTAPTEVTLFQ